MSTEMNSSTFNERDERFADYLARTMKQWPEGVTEMFNRTTSVMRAEWEQRRALIAINTPQDLDRDAFELPLKDSGISVNRWTTDDLRNGTYVQLGTQKLWEEYCDRKHRPHVVARVLGYTPGMGRVELQLPGSLPQWLELSQTVTVMLGKPVGL